MAMNEPLATDAFSHGVNQKGLRDHNERLILSLLQRHGAMPGSDIARHTHLSAQTVSVILRKLENDNLLKKGVPQKGKVGKPSVPMALNPGGAYAVGIKLGRRNSELFLTNFCGEVLFEKRLIHEVAIPQKILDFIRQGFAEAKAFLGRQKTARLCGIGIAVPFEIWKWGASDGNTTAEFLSWKDTVIEEEVAKFTNLPVFLVNDATSACWAENVYGHGAGFSNYAYFFISTFIGGGIVINQSVYEGSRGNAGALGSLRVGGTQGRTRQLIDVASIHLLENSLVGAGLDPRLLWNQPQDWTPLENFVGPWIETVANEIAQASLSACSVIDFEAVIIDGAFPSEVRHRLVEAVRQELPLQDSRGLILPLIEEGAMGGEARAIGAACAPIFSQYFLGRSHSVL